MILVQNDVTTNPELNPYTYVFQTRYNKTQHLRIPSSTLPNHDLRMPSSPKKHKITEEKSETWPCPDCSQKFKNKRNLKPHWQLKHAERDAGEVEAIKKKYKETRVNKAAEKLFGCSVCKKPFGYKHHAKEHIRVLHPDKNDANVIAFKPGNNDKRRQESVVTGASSSASVEVASTSSSASVEVASASSPLGGAAALSDRSGCDEMFKRSQHISQHSVDRIGVNIRIASLSSLNLGLPNLGLPNMGLPNLV